MSTAKLDRKPVIALLVAAALLVAISANSAAATTGNEDDKRITQSQHKQGNGRENAKLLRESRDEFDSGTAPGRRSSKSNNAVTQKSRSVASASPNTDFWFYIADVELFADDDRDGYYSGIDLLFDVDTYQTLRQ